MIKFKLPDLNKVKYSQTFFLGVLIACFVVAITAVYARLSIEDELYITKEHQSKIQRKFTESILSQEDVLNKIYSEDYKFNIYMGDLHLSVGDYAEAEAYYKQAMLLAPNDSYEHYLKLIIFYVRTNQPLKAEEIEKSVVDKNSQRLIKFKCKANLLIADYYYRINSGLEANKKYRLASFYFDKLHVRKVKSRKYIENGIMASYVQMADNFVRKENYLEAYRYLKRAEALDYSNLTIKYKLALVLSYINPMKAVEYFEIIKKQKPQMVSFHLFYETLMRAAEICNVRGDLPEAKLYTYKASSIKTFYEKNIANAEVIKLDFLHSKVQSSKKFDKFLLKFRLENITTHVLSNVKMDVIFYQKGSPVAKFQKTVLDKENYIRPGERSPIINIVYNAPQHYKKIDYEDVSFEIYLYSNEKYKSLMYQGNFSDSLVTDF